MITFSLRRWRNFTLMIICAIICLAVYKMSVISLNPANFYTGWILLSLMLFLTLYNLRKKLTFWPFLGSSAMWLQMHLYIGLLTVVVFAFHINFRIPNGALELVLTALFLLVIFSGVFGIIISRYFPKALNVRGETVLFERIRVYIRQLADQAEQISVASVEQTNSTTIADFYNKHLMPFFSGPKNSLKHLVNSKSAYIQMINQIEGQERYLNSDEKEILKELRELVETKDKLDYHYALQGALKGWLFVHIPITYSLLIVTFVHVILAYAFYGGVQ